MIKYVISKRWGIKKISEVLFFQEGPGVRKWQFKTSGIKLLNVANIVEGKLDLDKTDLFLDELEVKQKYNHFLIDEGDLVIASSGIKVDYFDKKIAFVKKENLPLCMNTSTIRFKALDSKLLDIKYFYYFLKTDLFKKQLSFFITGSAQLNFGPSHLKQMDMILPPLETQKKIADILEKAEKAIEKRKKADCLADEYLKSVFVDMFRGYLKDKNYFREINSVIDFIDYRGKTPEKSENGVRLITAKNVGFGMFRDEPKEYVSEELYSKMMTRGFPKANEVIFTTEGATLGFTTRIPRDFIEFAVGQRLITFRCCEKILPEYLEFILLQESTQKEVFRCSTGSSAKGIRSSELAKILIPLPPIALQNKFSQMVKKVETLKQKQKQSAIELDTLFKSLMQKAFKGEL